MEAMKMECKGFHVRITRDAFEKMRGFVNLCPTEVGGIMKGKIQEDGILLYEPFLFEQEVTNVTTELDPDAVFEAVMAGAASGADTSDWMCWFHSHVNMTARFSGKDLETIRLFSGDNPLVAIVMNKAGNYECRVDFYKPFQMVLHEVELEIVYEPNAELIAAVKKELTEKVSYTKISALEKRVSSGGKEGEFWYERPDKRRRNPMWPGGIGEGGVLEVRSDRANED